MQQRRDRDHRALGRQPKAAQGFQMLDRSHRLLLLDSGEYPHLKAKVVPKMGEAWN